MKTITHAIFDFQSAYEYDKSLKVKPSMIKPLERKYLSPTRFSKGKLFESMYNGKTILFKDYPINGYNGTDKNKIILSTLKNGLPKNEKIYIRYGSKRTLKKEAIGEVLDRWARGKSRFGVTDLHFRNTKYYDNVDAESISYFNLLPVFKKEVSFLEMLTLVISSKGIFSDSHSDDGDGSNHCFVGKKLWLAWDRIEGAKVGLEDCTYDNVFTQAKFDLGQFVRMKTSHWFLVQDGQTLFMPGNFAHKVVTLENYIGFGSFYLSFPNYIRSLKRWVLKYSGDVDEVFLDTLRVECPKYLKSSILPLPGKEKDRLGFGYLKKSLKNWDQGLNSQERSRFAMTIGLDELKKIC